MSLFDTPTITEDRGVANRRRTNGLAFRQGDLKTVYKPVADWWRVYDNSRGSSRLSIVMGTPIHPFFSTPEGRPAAARFGDVPFDAHVELLRLFLARRDEIVERIEGLLNAQRKPIEYLHGGPQLHRDVEDCFFTRTIVTRDQLHFQGQLDEAHWAHGFKPRESPGLYNDLAHPAEMMVRAFYLWQQTRWPGHSGRVRYAQTLFNLYVIRRLTLVSMRLWDAGSTTASERLSEVQRVLDALWKTAPEDQPVLMRDARWMIPLAQSPTTDDLAGYFEVQKHVAESLSEEDRGEIHKASVRMAGGHLRSQLRHLSVQKGVTVDENSLVLSTRRSNALDFATLIQGLVPVLEAYEHARKSGDSGKRLELASTIFQGISPDPEAFLNRLDLLGPYSMIEHLFIATDGDGNAAYTPMGRRHLQLVQEYEERIRRVSQPLHEDCRYFRPLDGAYSPYGALYGFSYNLIEHMALKTLERDAATGFTLEDVFDDGDSGKLAWVSGWRKLPHIKPDVAQLFEYPQQFAEEIFARIERALEKGASEGEANAAPTGRLFVLTGDDVQADSKGEPIPDLPVQYIRSSDRQIAAARRAHTYDQAQLLDDRLEGEFVVSYQTPGGWVGITKDILTDVLGAGRDAKIVGLPRAAGGVLKLMCPDLVTLPDP